jgi:GAF domain-containing protein
MSQVDAERLRNQVRVLEALRALTEAVGSQNEDGPVMSLTMRALVEITAADHAGVVLIDPDGAMGTVASEYPEAGALGIKIEAKDNPVFNELLKGRKSPFQIDDVETDARISPRVRELLQGLGTKAVIIAPLIVGEKLIGSVGLDLFTTTRRFKPDTLDLVETLTNQLAIFLQDVRTRRERERAIEQVRLLDQIGSRFLALNRVDDLLQEAARGLQGYLKSDRVIIRLGNPKESEEAGS